MVSIYFTRIQGPLPEDQHQALLALLPVSLQEKNRRFRNWQDQLLHLAGQLLLIEGLRQYGWDSRTLQALQYNAYGRPFLPGPIDFNISHSGAYVLCAIAENIKLGIDIEEIKNVSFGDFTQVMTSRQWMDINNSPHPVRSFFTYWTIKESVIKADTRGMSILLDDILVQNDQAVCDGKTWFLYQPVIDRDYATCLATDIPVQQVMLQERFPLATNDLPSSNTYIHPK